MLKIFSGKKRSMVIPLSILCAFLVVALALPANIMLTLPANAAVNYVQVRFDASGQAGGNMITEFVDSIGIPHGLFDDVAKPQNWAQSRFDNCMKFSIVNFAVWSHEHNTDAGFSEIGGVITYTGDRGPGHLTTKEYLDEYIYAGLKPVVFFHGVPAVLCSGGFSAGPYGYNQNLPTDANMTRYRQYVRAVAQYLANIYGVDEISKWAYEFVSEPDAQLAGDASQRSKTVDHWLAGLEDVIGVGNVYAGTYFSALSYTPILEAMTDHFTSGTNYCYGGTGTRLSYLGTSTWVFGGDHENNLDYLKQWINYYSNKFNTSEKMKNAVFCTLENGRAEPGIVFSRADQYGASYNAYMNDIYTQYPVRKNIINYGDWGTARYGSYSDINLFTPAFNMFRIERDMAGQRLLPASIAGTKANSTNLVGGYGSALDESTRKYNLVVYNFNTNDSTNVSESVRILLDNLPGTSATVREYVIDSSKNNWWTGWRQFRETSNNVPYVDRTGEPYYQTNILPVQWDIYQTTDDTGYGKYLRQAPAYVPQQNLYATHTTSSVSINDGVLQLNRTLPGHSVLYVTIETSPTVGTSGTNMGFESTSMSGWTTSGTVARSSEEKREGTYSAKLSGMSTAQAYAKQTVTGLTAGKRYTLSGWAKPKGTRMEYGIYMQRPGDSSSRVTCNGSISPLQEWNRVAVTLEADSNGQLEIGIIAPQQVNQKAVYFDSLRMQRSGVDGETCQELTHFGFNENTGSTVNDSSPLAFTGAISGATWTTGKYGSALNFDGINDDVQIANQYLNISSDFSLTAWIKAPQDRTKWHVLLAKGPKDTGHFEMGLNPDGKLYFYAPDMGQFETGNTLDDNAWHHIAVIRKGNSIKLYTDNVERYSATAHGIIVTENENVRIGTLLDGTCPFKGVIDDVQIYSGALTASQLTSVYNGSEPYSRPVPTPVALPAANPSPTPAPTATPTPSPTPMPDNLIGSWNLNENSGSTVNDRSSLGNNGAVTGASWTGGKFGNALSFDGSGDYVNISNTSVNIGSSFTISAWIKTGQNRSSWRVFLAKGPKDTGHYELAVDLDGKLRFYAPDIGDFNSNSVVDDNVWHHVAVTYDGSRIKFYVDELLKNTITASGTVASETETMRFGTLVDGTFSYIGLLDEIRIYNRTLEHWEVGSLFRNSTNFDNRVYSEWRFDENSGSTVYDTSVYRFNGTMYYTTWVDGRYGKALYFNGSSPTAVEINHTSVNVSKNFSISAWIKPEQDRSGWHVILNKGPKNSGHFELNIDPDGKLGFYSHEMGGISSNTVVDDNNWRHAVVTCDGSNLRIYVDKVLKNTVAISSYITSEIETVRMGLNFEGMMPYKGTLDEVKIINRALTQAEIDALYNGQ